MQISAAVRRASAFTVADPGRIRLRSAAATTFSLLLAIVAMLGFTRLAGQPVTVAMLGAVLAMQSSAAVKDRDQRSRNITTLLLFIPSVGAVTLAAFLAPHGKIADVGFIAVLFGAVWVRRYGPRGNALGMVAFISYFFALFLRAPMHQVPVLAVAVAVGIASSLAVHVLAFPDRPRVEVRRLLSALRSASTAALEVASTQRGLVSVEVLRRRLDQLGETALLIDDWLDRHEAAKSLSVTSKDLALRVFEAQIMLEQAASFMWSLDPDEPWPDSLCEAVAALRACLTNNPTEEQLRQARRSGSAAAENADLSTSAGVTTMAAYRAMQAHLAIHHITTNARGISDEDLAAVAVDDDDEDDEPGLNPSTKAAIQVAVATSAATVLGELISPDRWYWAVLTAFLVFTGVTTRGEILSRVGHRLVGTVAGVVAGVLLAAVIGPRPPLQIIVLLVCVFFAFYLVTVAYFWLTFFVTVLLAMLYGLLGNFSLQVLELRIVETAAGGLVGIASAFFIFSTKTRTTFTEEVDEYLDRMEQVIDTAVTSVLAPEDTNDLVADTRRLDNALKAAITASKPLQIGPLSDLRRGVRRLMRGLQIANRSAHALARAGVTAAHGGEVPDGADDALHQAAARAHDAVAAVRTVIAGEDLHFAEKRSETAAFDIGMPEMRPSAVRAAVRALNLLDRTLTEVSTRV